MKKKIILITVLLTALIGVAVSYGSLAQLWKTGQVTSFAAGDDGSIQAGADWPAPRFTDNGDGTVTDGLTGLMWLKDANCFGYQTWTNALAKVADLSANPTSYTCNSYTASYNDWRLPNRKELLSLIDRGRANPALPAGHPFVNVMTGYWSGSAGLTSTSIWTSFAGWSTVGNIWQVSVNMGNASRTSATGISSVWPVRTTATGGSDFTISTSAGAGGTITPSGAVPVAPGGSQTFSIDANAGYYIADVAVDGASIGAVNSYTFTNVTANHTISASFGRITYTITASAGSNGTISPSGAVSVGAGDSQTFFINASSGYSVADVVVDGVSAGPLTSYVFSNVQSNHTISASFVQVTYTLTVSKAGTGSGTVSSSPAGIDCGGSCSASYASGTLVTLTASADAGAAFIGWSVSGPWTTGSGSCSGTAPCIVRMDTARTVTATFNSAVTDSITVTQPNGGESIRRNTTYLITWSYAGNPGTKVTVDLMKAGALVKTLTTRASIGSNGTGSYSWSVSKNQAVGADYTIRLTTSGGYSDTSNAAFSITQ